MSNRKYEGDGHNEKIDPARLTIGCVLRMPYLSGSVSAFGDSTVTGIYVSYSPAREAKERTGKRHFPNLQAALLHANSSDYVFVKLARPYCYANNPFESMPNWLVGVEEYEVLGHRVVESHKVVVQSDGSYATFNSK